MSAAKKAPAVVQPIETGKGAKRTYFRQADFPQTDLQQAQKIASALVDDLLRVKRAHRPTSRWPLESVLPAARGSTLTGSAVAYGLSDGGINANTIKLTPLGRKLVAQKMKATI